MGLKLLFPGASLACRQRTHLPQSLAVFRSFGGRRFTSRVRPGLPLLAEPISLLDSTCPVPGGRDWARVGNNLLNPGASSPHTSDSGLSVAWVAVGGITLFGIAADVETRQGATGREAGRKPLPFFE